MHVRCIRDLLKSVGHDDAYNGIESSSLSFLSTITNGDVLGSHLNVKYCFLNFIMLFISF